MYLDKKNINAIRQGLPTDYFHYSQQIFFKVTANTKLINTETLLLNAGLAS